MIVDHIIANDIAIEEMMWLAMQGGAFEWLAEEPELYSPEDDKPAQWLQKVSSTNLSKSELSNTGKPAAIIRNQIMKINPGVRKQKHQTK